MRRPLERRPHPGASGPHRGIETANYPQAIFAACCARGEGFDPLVYEKMQTTISLAGLFDILEGLEVRESWVRAAHLNARERGPGDD